MTLRARGLGVVSESLIVLVSFLIAILVRFRGDLEELLSYRRLVPKAVLCVLVVMLDALLRRDVRVPLAAADGALPAARAVHGGGRGGPRRDLLRRARPPGRPRHLRPVRPSRVGRAAALAPRAPVDVGQRVGARGPRPHPRHGRLRAQRGPGDAQALPGRLPGAGLPDRARGRGRPGPGEPQRRRHARRPAAAGVLARRLADRRGPGGPPEAPARWTRCCGAGRRGCGWSRRPASSRG